MGGSKDKRQGKKHDDRKQVTLRINKRRTISEKGIKQATKTRKRPSATKTISMSDKAIKRAKLPRHKAPSCTHRGYVTYIQKW